MVTENTSGTLHITVANKEQTQAIPCHRLDLMSQMFFKLPKRQHQLGPKFSDTCVCGWLFIFGPYLGLGRILSSPETDRNASLNVNHN